MSWELLALGALLLAMLVGLVAWALTSRGAVRQRVEDLEDHADEHEEYHKRGEEFDAGGGLGGGIARARRLRDASRDRDV